MAIIQQESMHADSLDAALERARRDRALSEERRKARLPMDTLSRFAEGAAPIAGAGIGAAVGGLASGGNPAAITAGFGAGGGLGQGLGGLIGLGRSISNEDDQALADRGQLQQQQLMQLLARRRG